MCFITDLQQEAYKKDVTLVQLREKKRTTREYLALAEKAHELTQQYDIPLIIDGRVDITLAVIVKGCAFEQSDIPVAVAHRLIDDKIVGVTAKTVPQKVETYE